MKLKALNVSGKGRPIWGSLNQTSEKTWVLYVSDSGADKSKCIKIELMVEDK
jgi:hypothetical protein